MKFLMVVIICFGTNICKGIFDKQVYNSYDECPKASKPVVQYMKDIYPNSSGEIYCMTEPEFNEYYDYLENGGKLTIQQHRNQTSS